MEDQNKDNMNMNEDMEKTDSSSGDSWVWMIGALIVLVVVGLYLWQGGAQVPPADNDTATTTEENASPDDATTTEPQAGEDSLEDIEQQLEGINIDDIEGEFEGIDQDLQELEEGGE